MAELRRLRVLSGHLQLTPSSCAAQDGPSAGFKFVKLETKGRVGIITLWRPKALNALNDALMAEVGRAVEQFENNNDISVIIVTGSGRAFAAGADILEMKDKSFFEMSMKDKIKPWERLSQCKIPTIAAVNGFALGGGCEVAMMCDIIIASEAAKFGQPEISIGTIPGAGGTQRLTRVVGKSKAMELVLSGRQMSAQEALQRGLVSQVVPADQLLDTALKLANEIAAKSRPVLVLAKESVNQAYESTLATGMQIERRLFHSTFGLADQKEGMAAFAAKKPAQFQHK